MQLEVSVIKTTSYVSYGTPTLDPQTSLAYEEQKQFMNNKSKKTVCSQGECLLAPDRALCAAPFPPHILLGLHIHVLSRY